MRRGLAALILGLSLVVASVAWSGYVLTHTVLDPDRSERLADQLLDNEVLRAALIGRLADSMEAAVPGEAAVPRQLLEVAAATALDDPNVEAIIRTGIVDTHRAALEGNAEPVTIDAAALGSAGRSALVTARPELDALLPATPTLEVELPVGGLSVLGRIRAFVVQATTIGAFIAIIGATAAFAIAKNRPAVLRRVAFWAFGTAAFWLVIGFGIPFLADKLAPSSTAIISAIIDVFFGAMIRPGLLMAAFGGACLAASFFWAAGSATAGGRMLQPAAADHTATRPETGRRRGFGVTESNVRQAPAAGAQAQQAAAVAAAAEHAARQQAYAAQQQAIAEQHARRQAAQQPAQFTQPPATAPAPTHRPAPDPTTAMPQARPSQPQAQPQAPQQQPQAPRWEPGVGYIDGDA